MIGDPSATNDAQVDFYLFSLPMAIQKCRGIPNWWSFTLKKCNKLSTLRVNHCLHTLFSIPKASQSCWYHPEEPGCITREHKATGRGPLGGVIRPHGPTEATDFARPTEAAHAKGYPMTEISPFSADKFCHPKLSLDSTE